MCDCWVTGSSDQVTSNDQLNAYGESESDVQMKKGEERKTNTW